MQLSCVKNVKELLPEKTPNELTSRNGEEAETMNATAVVRDVKNIARAERLKRTKITSIILSFNI